ncbi:MAG: ABC transporter permease [Actinomycetota bacterium]
MSIGGAAQWRISETRSSIPFGRVRKRLLLFLAAAVIGVVLLPVAYLLIRAAGAEQSSWDLILRGRTLWLTIRTAGLALAVTVASVAVGVPLAWLTTRTDLPFRRFWAVLVSLPLVIPSYVGAFALIATLGPRGMLQQMLEPLGVERLPDISGFPGAFLALTLFTYPYVFLMVAAAVRGLDPSLEDAARSLGTSPFRTFRRVTLPLLRPSVAAGALLVALYTLHDFGAISLMRFPAFTQAIYLQYKGAFDRTPAAILSLVLVALAVIVLALEQRARGRARYYRSGTGSKRPATPVSLGKWKWPALVFCAAVTSVAFALPVSVIVLWFVRGIGLGEGVRLTWTAAGGSVLVSGVGAAFALACAVPVALFSTRYSGRIATTFERASFTAYALPGIVVGLAFVFFAANLTPWLYQSLPLVVVAYVVLFLPQAVQPLRASLLQIGPRPEEAARALGRKGTGLFLGVVAPLVSRPALAAAALVFLTAMKELPATLLLRPTGFETLATRVWTGATAGLYSRAAGPALMLIVICAVPLYVLARRVEVGTVREVEVRTD